MGRKKKQQTMPEPHAPEGIPLWSRKELRALFLSFVSKLGERETWDGIRAIVNGAQLDQRTEFPDPVGRDRDEVDELIAYLHTMGLDAFIDIANATINPPNDEDCISMIRHFLSTHAKRRGAILAELCRYAFMNVPNLSPVNIGEWLERGLQTLISIGLVEVETDERGIRTFSIVKREAPTQDELDKLFWMEGETEDCSIERFREEVETRWPGRKELHFDALIDIADVSHQLQQLGHETVLVDPSYFDTTETMFWIW